LWCQIQKREQSGEWWCENEEVKEKFAVYQMPTVPVSFFCKKTANKKPTVKFGAFDFHVFSFLVVVLLFCAHRQHCLIVTTNTTQQSVFSPFVTVCSVFVFKYEQ
jgi:hypothetical protein